MWICEPNAQAIASLEVLDHDPQLGLVRRNPTQHLSKVGVLILHLISHPLHLLHQLSLSITELTSRNGARNS